MAELAWALILACARNIALEDRRVRTTGKWQTTIGTDLRGKTLGLLGLGRIGGETARMAPGFGMKVISWSRSLTPERASAWGQVHAVSKDDLLMRSDFLVVALAGGRETANLIGPREIDRMKHGAYLINISRASCVDQAAMIAALESGKLAGAGLDVFDVEPLPPGHRLLALDNVVIHPAHGECGPIYPGSACRADHRKHRRLARWPAYPSRGRSKYLARSARCIVGLTSFANKTQSFGNSAEEDAMGLMSSIAASIGLSAAMLTVMVATGIAVAAELPPTLKKVMEERKLDPALLEGLDAELALSPAIVEGARKEGKVSVRMTIPPRQFEQVKAAFNERYPFIKVEYLTAVGRDRATAPLIALKAGNYLSDLITGFSVVHDEFMKMDGLVDLRVLPAYASAQPFVNSDDGRSTAAQTNYWCTAYNTQKIKKSELPATWDALVDNPRFRNGVVGMANRPQVWLAHLWGTMGESWTQSIMTRIFRDLRPQLRHESITALPKLATVGEFDMAVPAGDFLLRGYINQGMPLGFHCPEPMPVASTALGLLKGSPNPNAALLITNWMLSREGQILFFHFVEAVPTHRALQIPALLPFPEEVKGKKIAPSTNATEAHQGILLEQWVKHWQSAGGPKEEAR